MCTQTCCYATGSSVACASATLLALLLPRRLAALLLACVYNWHWCVWVNSPKCTKRQAAWYASGWQTAAKAAASRPPTRPPGHQPRPPGHPATRTTPGHPATNDRPDHRPRLAGWAGHGHGHGHGPATATHEKKQSSGWEWDEGGMRVGWWGDGGEDKDWGLSLLRMRLSG